MAKKSNQKEQPKVEKNYPKGKVEKLSLQDVREIEAQEIIDDVMKIILEIK